jgi:hypothetical protein
MSIFFYKEDHHKNITNAYGKKKKSKTAEARFLAYRFGKNYESWPKFSVIAPVT